MKHFWETVLRPTIELLQPKTIVEIGAGEGQNTLEMLKLLKGSGSLLHCIDPHPAFDVQKAQEEFGSGLAFHFGLSLNELEGIGPADLVLIDGDHNWYTVLGELRLIAKIAASNGGRFPVVYLHDTWWPYGRRDLYYNPDNIPSAFQQPHKRSGIDPDQHELTDDSPYNDHLQQALYENSLQNGVLTAVEDFLRETTLELCFFNVRVFHGFGVLVERQLKEANTPLAALISELTQPSLLQTLLEQAERERIRLQVSQKKLTRQAQARNRDIAAMREERATRNAEVAKTTESLKELEKGIRKVGRERDAALAALTTAKADVEKLSREKSKATAASAALEQEISRLSAQLQQSERQRLELHAAVSDKAQTQTRELLDQQRMALELERKNSVLTRLENELAAARASVERLESDLDMARAQNRRQLFASDVPAPVDGALRVSQKSAPGQPDKKPADKQPATTQAEGTKASANADPKRQDKQPKPDKAAAASNGNAKEADVVAKEKAAKDKVEKEKAAALTVVQEGLLEQLDYVAATLAKVENERRHLILLSEQAELNGATGGTPAARTVDVVVCVYNALDDVKTCVRSVLRHLPAGGRLLLVNDGSGPGTTRFLRKFQGNNRRRVSLLEHRRNRGYTWSVNTGLRNSNADYVILLNSDTLVTPGWIEGLIACGESSRKIGIVGPLSNAASWQNVPELLGSDGKFAVNRVPAPLDPDGFAQLVHEVSAKVYPRVPFVNGFCFAIKRAVLDAVGLFDTESFPQGYGEENDYCIRTSKAGFELAIADDVFVYHAKSKSFGHERRKTLSSTGKSKLESKHGVDTVKQLADSIKTNPQLRDIRDRVVDAINQCELPDAARRMAREKVLFLLPARGGGGGVHSVVQEAAMMRQLGVDVQVAVPTKHLKSYLTQYDALYERSDLFVPFEPESLAEVTKDASVVIATVHSSMWLVRQIVAVRPTVLPTYYIQDYEPYFFPEGSFERMEAEASYSLLPGTLAFAKTQWLTTIVGERHGLPVHKVEPSLDTSVYYPPEHERTREYIEICAMVRPKTPRRGAARTMKVLEEIRTKYRKKVRIHIFGCEPDDPAFAPIKGNWLYKNHGILKREGVAKLLRRCHVFIDLSDYQAFGRTGLEAMACGCAVVNPVEGGTDEYCVHGENSLLVDPRDHAQCVEALERLVRSGNTLRKMQQLGLETAARYSTLGAAVSELTVLADGLEELRKHGQDPALRRAIVVPTEIPVGPFDCASVSRLELPLVKRACVPRLLAFSHPGLTTDALESSNCELLVLQRGAFANVQQMESLMVRARMLGIALIYVADEHCVELDRHGEIQLTSEAAYFSAQANRVIANTDELAQLFTAKDVAATVVRDALDEKLWHLLPGGPTVPEQSSINEPAVIGCFGDGYSFDESSALLHALRRIREKYGDGVRFELVDGQSSAILAPEPFTRVGLPRDTSYQNLARWKRVRCQWQIALAPLANTPLHRVESHLRWLEYSAIGAATIANPSPDLVRSIVTGETGLLVEDAEDAWYDAISALLDDPERRRQLASAARAAAATSHGLFARAAEYASALDSAGEVGPSVTDEAVNDTDLGDSLPLAQNPSAV